MTTNNANNDDYVEDEDEEPLYYPKKQLDLAREEGKDKFIDRTGRRWFTYWDEPRQSLEWGCNATKEEGEQVLRALARRDLNKKLLKKSSK